MSTPISTCQIVKAVCEGPPWDRVKALLHTVEFNLNRGACSVWDCRCEPSCMTALEKEFTQEKSDAFAEYLMATYSADETTKERRKAITALLQMM